MLYAGISSNVFEEAVDFAKLCADHAVDAVAATLPSYYPLTDSQMQSYFEQLADAIPVPLIIYNIPATTHMSIPLAVIDELSMHENIVAVKDGHFLGWAAKSAIALIGGSDGLIPSTGNFVPGVFSGMWNAFRDNNFKEVYAMQLQSDRYGNIYQADKTLGQSLWALKVLMHAKGLCGEVVMPPLQPMSDDERQKILESFAGMESAGKSI